MSHASFSQTLVDRAAADVVGRRREVEIVVSALAAARHILLEGPPGTGKSTLLRAVARHGELPLIFVEGNAELTPARLVGHFDPALVLSKGYAPEVYVPGPLASAMETGALLYVEEINRVPEETLNLLVTAMSERELHVPRWKKLIADPQFRIVAAMNPFDAVGTARISSAIYDRVCRVSVGYQDAAAEAEIVRRELEGDDPLVSRAVAVTRATRDHADVRIGSSVRGAIDLVLLAARLREIRDDETDVGLDSALTALSGRIRVHESSGRTPEEIVAELWAATSPSAAPEDPSGKA